MEGTGKMAKFDTQRLKKDEETKWKVDVVEEPKVEEKILLRVKLLIDATVKVTGTSGREYLFAGAGSIVDVEQEDVDHLLAKRQGRQCCGGGDGTPVFELAGE